MALAVQEVARGIRIDPDALVKLDFPFEHCSSSRIGENGNGHDAPTALKETVVFKAPKPGGNGNGHHEEALGGTVPLEVSKLDDNGTERPLTPLERAAYYKHCGDDRRESEFEAKWGHGLKRPR